MERPTLNYRYYNKEIDDELPYTGVLNVDPETGHIYDEDGDVVEIGNMAWKVMVTPGHTKGGTCWYLVPQFGNHEDGAPVLISGDTLFEGSVGRTDFEGGSMKEMRASLRKLAFLPDETIVLPGHGRQTTIGAERSRTFAQWA